MTTLGTLRYSYLGATLGTSISKGLITSALNMDQAKAEDEDLYMNF